MSKEKKAELLNKLNNGKITFYEFKQQINVLYAGDPDIIIFQEIEPRVFYNEELNLTINGNEKPKLPGNYAYIRIKHFYDDGTPIPPISSSEKELADRILLEHPDID